MRELHIDKSIDVLNFGAPANTTPVVTELSNLVKTSYVSNNFFTVEKWEISGPIDFIKTAPYTLCSVLDGQGSLTVAGISYPVQKGDHFILTSDISDWQFEGQLTIIASHDGE